jgi:hypothetical protein
MPVGNRLWRPGLTPLELVGPAPAAQRSPLVVQRLQDPNLARVSSATRHGRESKEACDFYVGTQIASRMSQFALPGVEEVADAVVRELTEREPDPLDRGELRLAFLI